MRCIVIDSIKRAAQKGASTFVRSELGRRVMTSPQVQAAAMKALSARAHLRQQITKRVQDFAKDHKLVTKEDVAKLRRSLREMEATIAQLRSELEKQKTSTGD